MRQSRFISDKTIEILIISAVLLALAFAVTAFGQGGLITQGGSAYVISSPYAAADLFEIQYVQSADVMYLVHNAYPPQILRRYGDTNWTIADVNLTTGPFMADNETQSATLTPSATSGDISLTASVDTFYAGHVGALWQITHYVESDIERYTIDTDECKGSLEVGLNQDFIIATKENWIGDLTIEKSYDGGSTWKDVHNYSAAGNYDNLVYMGTETVADAVYRVCVENFEFADPSYVRDLRVTLTAVAYERQGIVRITGVSDARHANAAVLYELGDTAATYKWAEGSFSDYRGYPAAVALFQERLVFAGTPAEPQAIWFSQTDDWHNFLKNNLDTSAMTMTIAADQLNAVRWLASHSDFIVGTSGDEWKLYTSNDKAISPSNQPSIKRQSTYGSAAIQPVVINNKVVYVQRNAKKILRTGYTIESDNWRSEDVTLLAEHITGAGVVEMAYQRVPYQILWAVCQSGDLLCCVLEDNQQVLGWSRYVFDGDCESVTVKPGSTEDEVWIIVKRTIEGTDYRYVEQFMPFNWGGDDADAFFVDSGLSFDGGDAVGITGVTRADPAVVTAPGHTFTDGMNVRFADVGGMTELNNKVYTVSTVGSSSFELRDRTDGVDINSVDFTAYSSGGTVIRVENSFSGLDHIEGKTVAASADAGYAGTYTVSSGAVTLSDYFNKVHIGLPYTAKVKPMRLEFLSTGGALQGRAKRITAATLRLYKSMGGGVGPNFTTYDTMTYRDAGDLLEAATPFFSGDKRMLFRGGWLTEGDICVRQALPLPFTLLAMILEFEANE